MEGREEGRERGGKDQGKDIKLWAFGCVQLVVATPYEHHYQTISLSLTTAVATPPLLLLLLLLLRLLVLPSSPQGSMPPFINQELVDKCGAKRRLTVIGDVSCDPNSTNNPIPLYDAITSW